MPNVLPLRCSAPASVPNRPMMHARLYKPDDHATLQEWCVGHRSESVPAAVLPPCGLVVEDAAGAPCAIAFLYMAVGVGVAWLAWMTTSPRLAPPAAARALKALLGAADAVCREHGYGLLFTMTNRSGLGTFLQRQGFKANHRNAAQYFREVPHGT